MAGESKPDGGRESRFLIVGTVRRAHGIRGEFSVAVETDRPDAVFTPGRVLRLGDAQGRPGDEVITVAAARPFKDGLLIKTAEHTQRNEASEALRGKTLLIAEAEAAPLANDEVFFHHLIGLRVQVDAEPIGRVRDVVEGNAAPLLVIERPGASDLLVPYVSEMVTRVDVAEQVLQIDPPPGLLEL